MKLNKTAIAVGAVLFSSSALAEISANIGATSNYLWRGVTQTGDDAAISGGVDYANDIGLYAGTWVSNVDYNGASAEVDFYGGFAGEFGDGFGFDVGGIYYLYPGADDEGNNEDEIDFFEVYASLSFSFLEGGLAYTVWKEDDDADESDIYYYLSAGTEIAPTWSIGATVGYYDFDDGTDYSHGQVSVAKDVGDFGEFSLAVSTVFDQDDDLDLDNSAIFTVSWAKTF